MPDMFECPFCNYACEDQLEYLEHYDGCAEEHALREGMPVEA